MLSFNTKRKQRNEKINYARLIVAVEGVIAKKRELMDTVPIFSDEWHIASHDRVFWEARLVELRAKNG